MTDFLPSSLSQLQSLTLATYNPQIAPVATALWEKHLQRDNPLWNYVTAKPFTRNVGSRSAHVMAMVDKRLPGRGLVGYFACTDSEMGAEVLKEACYWLHQQYGIQDVYGPIHGTATADYRLNLSEDFWFPGEPVNPLFHIYAFREAGFSDYNQYVSGVAKHYRLFTTLITELPKQYNGIQLRSYDTSKTLEDLAAFHDLMIAIFPSQSLYCPKLSWEERVFNFKDKIPPFNPRYTYFLENNRSPIGVIVAYPYQKKLIVKTIAILPKYRGRHLSGLLIRKVHEAAAVDGLSEAVYAMIRVGNTVYNMKKPGISVARRYVTMRKSFSL
jgi:hypothetical protein